MVQDSLRPFQRDEETRERSVQGFLRIVDEFGSATERFFGRIYRGFSRKQQMTGQPPDQDRQAAIRQVNRELSGRIRDAEMNATRLHAVFASITEGVIMQDAEGRIVIMNEAARRLLGSIKVFWESDLGRMFESARGRMPQEGEEMEPIGEPVRIQVNNRIIGARLAAVATPEGFPLGTIIALTDVTREALADRLKDEFVTQLTHELRSPLTAIKGMSEVLLSQPEDRPPNRKFLEAIGRNASILDRMITELLDISEIGAGSFAVRKDTISLDQLLIDVIKGQEVRIKKSDLNVGMMVVNRSQIQVIGDDRRLRWAIGHVLDNAINYTLKGGFIIIRLGMTQGERILLEVADNGVGIAEKDLPHIFERFYRGEAKTPDGKTLDPRGLGQGLFVARAVAEAHGGYLAVSSTTGQGSKFTMALPFARDDALPPPYQAGNTDNI